MIRWNSEELESIYNAEMKLASKEYTPEELDRIDLSRLFHQTKSRRILQMVEVGYTIGELESVKKYGEKKESEFWFKWLSRRAKESYTAENIEELSIDTLLKRTKSTRITHMVKLAYTLGKLRGIRTLNEGRTKIRVPKLFIGQ